MRKNYERPILVVDRNLAEGVYLASGESAGTLNVSNIGILDRWDGGGKGLASVSWSQITGTVHLTINFSDTIDDVEVSGVAAQQSVSGSTVTLSFSGAESDSLMLGVHVNHGTSIDALAVTGFNYSVS